MLSHCSCSKGLKHEALIQGSGQGIKSRDQALWALCLQLNESRPPGNETRPSWMVPQALQAPDKSATAAGQHAEEGFQPVFGGVQFGGTSAVCEELCCVKGFVGVVQEGGQASRAYAHCVPVRNLSIFWALSARPGFLRLADPGNAELRKIFNSRKFKVVIGSTMLWCC